MTDELQRRRWFACLLLAAGLAAGGGAVLWERSTAGPVSVPLPDLEGVFVPVAAALRAAGRDVEEEPRSAAAWGRLGMLLMAHRWHAEARICFSRSRALAPGRFRWAYYRAVLLEETDLQAADAAYAEAARLRPGYAPLYVRRAYALGQLGHADEAARMFRRAAELAPSVANPLIALGRLLRNRGKLDRALAVLKEARMKQPDARAVHQELAATYFALGKPAAAAAAKEAVVTADESPTIIKDTLMAEMAGLRFTKQP